MTLREKKKSSFRWVAESDSVKGQEIWAVLLYASRTSGREDESVKSQSAHSSRVHFCCRPVTFSALTDMLAALCSRDLEHLAKRSDLIIIFDNFSFQHLDNDEETARLLVYKGIGICERVQQLTAILRTKVELQQKSPVSHLQLQIENED